MILGIIFMSSTAFAGTLDENQSKKQDLANQSKELQSQLSELKNNVEEKQEYKNTLDEQIAVVRSEIELSNEKIAALDAQIAEKEESIEKTNSDIEENRKALKKRLKAIYTAGEASNIEIILGAKDFSDFLDKAEIVKNVADHDNKLIDNLNNNLESLEKDKRELEDYKKSVEEEKAVADQKKQDFQALSNEMEEVIAQLETEQTDVKNKIDVNDAEIQKIDAQIEAYYQEQARLEQERLAQQERDRQQQEYNQYVDNTTSDVTDNVIDQPTSDGYAWPVPGFFYISSDYYDTDGRSGMHGAIDIAGGGIYGANVVAAESGKVILCCSDGYGGGYGNYVVIDHGNGKSTLYAHMSSVATSLGQYVSKGQTIGYVGNTGFSTGPHLHFETRRNGYRYNPMDEYPWL